MVARIGRVLILMRVALLQYSCHKNDIKWRSFSAAQNFSGPSRYSRIFNWSIRPGLIPDISTSILSVIREGRRRSKTERLTRAHG